jgi:hypothetical protein
MYKKLKLATESNQFIFLFSFLLHLLVFPSFSFHVHKGEPTAKEEEETKNIRNNFLDEDYQLRY